MKKDQITRYEACKKDLEQIVMWKNQLPFDHQNHGCGSRDHVVYHELQAIHDQMYITVKNAMDEAIETIKLKIENI